MHRRPTAAFALACALLAVLSACRSADPHIVVRGHEIRPRTYSLVLWHQLVRARLSPASQTRILLPPGLREREEVFEALRDDGTFVLTGPFNKGREELGLDYLWVLDLDDVSEARGLTDLVSDVGDGIAAAEVLPLQTLDVLRFVPQLDAGAREEEARGGLPVLRAYCAVLAEDGERVSRLLDGDVLGPKVALMGRLGGERDGALFAILDVEGPEVARPYLIAASGGRDVPGVELSQVFLTPALHTLLVEGPPPAR